MQEKKIRKILFLQAFPLQGGGSGIYTRELATEMGKEKDVKVAVVCPEGREKIANLKIYPLDLPFPACFGAHPEWPVCRLYKTLSSKEIIDVFKSFLQSVVRAVEDFQPDVLHVQHVSLLLWVANIIKSLYGKNFVVTIHGTGITAARENRKYIPLSQDALKRAKIIIAVSKDAKQRMLETFGTDFGPKVKIMPPGIRVEKFPSERSTKLINKKYNLEGKKVVLFTGRLIIIKGTEYLVQAAKYIKGDVYIIGDGPERKNLEELAKKLSLNNVHFLGYMGDESREELMEFYYRADVFVAPSIADEALGLVILEAMACNTPVVATRKGGMISLIKDRVNGFLVRPKNSREIADACNKILGNNELAIKMKENAKRMVTEKFSWEKITHKYLRVYNETYINGSKQKPTERQKNPPESNIQAIKL